MKHTMDDPSLDLTVDQVNELEEQRLDQLDAAGIDEEYVLDRSLKQMQNWTAYFGDNITRGKRDFNFCVKDQWDARERADFQRLGKPALTANKIYDSTKKVIGEQRKNKPDLMVRSINGRAKQESITLRGDLVRSISYASENDLVYQTAFRSALMMGYGAFQVMLEYETPKSFNKVIRYDLIVDPTSCSWDPAAHKPHKGDGNYCSRRYLFTKDEFIATYPHITDPISFVDSYWQMDYEHNTRDTIIVCDQYVKEWHPQIIYKLSDGRTVTDDQWKEIQKRFSDGMEIVQGTSVEDVIKKQIPRIVAERKTQSYKIMHYRMLKNQIIEFSEWPSKYLPIPFVDGDSQYIEGRQYTKSFISESIDSQKLLNYSMSELAAELKNRRREQWLGTPDNIAGYEQDWRNPELQISMLRAKPDPRTGAMPQKMPAWEISQGLFATMQTSTQSLREVIGFSESEELQGRDMSGRARRERKLEGSMSAYVFFDNLNQAIEQGGRITLDLLPYIIGDEEREFSVRKRDGSANTVTVNKRDKDDTVLNRFQDDDEYDIEIDTGPSFAVQRDVALEFMADTIKAFPQAFPLIADLWVSNLDMEQRDIMKERFKSLVPPEIIAKEEGKQPPPKQPDPQAMMMQAEMQMKQEQIKQKQAEVQIKAQELELKKEQNELAKAELMLKGQKTQMDAELNVFDHKANLEKSRITHSLDAAKLENESTHKIAAILADLYKHHNTLDKAS